MFNARLVFAWARKNFPLLGVILIALIIGWQNIRLGTSYSGWDNIIAEFDLGRYARQVLFGAWSEHQGLGGASAQGQLAEVTRLPFLFLFKWLLPDNLIRYAYIFITYLLGGVGMYFYIALAWCRENKRFGRWLAFLGGSYYLLHILTLQQFYISFEMFMAQFAFLPFLLLLLHRFVPTPAHFSLKKIFSVKNLLLFILVQFLLSPSAHTQTVFYLGTAVSLVYVFALSSHLGLFRALLLSFLIGLLTLVINFYWIGPNIYYGIHNAHYVSESRDNQLFGPESVGSIRDASNFSNLASGTQYLFNWKDYSFAKEEFQFIFNEWQTFLARPTVFWSLQFLGVVTLLGLFTTIWDKKKGVKRLAIVGVYIFCLILIWIDLFPTSILLDLLYRSPSFLEAFRNPFTKLSIIYSLVSVLLFLQPVDLLLRFLQKRFKANALKNLSGLVVIGLFFSLIVYVSWPSFLGNFISEKLSVVYPAEYGQMFDYLKTRDKNLRVLQLPQLSHAGWEYYDWQFLGLGNGYQGMGFYFFGFPQAFLGRDSDRWAESSDFFYHELKYALDKKDVAHFNQVLTKYKVDLVIIDETKIEPTRAHNYESDFALVEAAGLQKVWAQNFLTVYERFTPESVAELFVPPTLTLVEAGTDRVRQDLVFAREGDYALLPGGEAPVVYPFNRLLQYLPEGLEFDDEEQTVAIAKNLTSAEYEVTIPGIAGTRYQTPFSMSYDQGAVEVLFPEVVVTAGAKVVRLAKIANFSFSVAGNPATILVSLGEQGVVLEQGAVVQPVLDLAVGSRPVVSYLANPDNLVMAVGEKVDVGGLNQVEVGELSLNWSSLTSAVTFVAEAATQVSVKSTFPSEKLPLTANPSVNCGQPERGQIKSTAKKDGIYYEADGYGVNCNGLAFDYASTAGSYLLRVAGGNLRGRGTKLFINYSDREIVHEDYLFGEKKFAQTLALPSLGTDARQSFFLNWETRSFGKTSANRLESMTLTAFPLARVAGIKLMKTDESGVGGAVVVSDLTLVPTGYWFDSLHTADFTCRSERCAFALDQSFDDFWLAFDFSSGKFLPHLRFNNWGNLWLLEKGQGQVVIFYLPELVAFSSLIFTASLISVLLIIFLRQKVSSK